MSRNKNKKSKATKPRKIKTSWRQKLVTGGIVSLILIFLLGMIFSRPMIPAKRANNNQPTTNSSTPPPKPQFTAEGKLDFMRGDSAITSVEIEIADTPRDIEMGLMHRRTMRHDRAMLFIFPEERLRNFWMKNCHFPQDMIFVGADKKIVSIQRNTQPYSEAQVPSNVPAQYVVEVNAGFADAYKLAVGDIISF